jgi:hypothetical protein
LKIEGFQGAFDFQCLTPSHILVYTNPAMPKSPVVDTPVVIGLNAVIVAVTQETPRILTVTRTDHALAERPASGQRSSRPRFHALPFGPFDPVTDRTLELGVRRWVREQTGLELGYVEQLYTFGDRHRDPSERAGGPRVISVAYLALVREAAPAGSGGALWRDSYAYLPWEDWRSGRPELIDTFIVPALRAWADSAPDEERRRERRERRDIAFGLGGAPWVPQRVLERYELAYEVGLSAEATRDYPEFGARPLAAVRPVGQPMALDHRRILATALGRLRGKLRYRPVIFELLPAAFTLLQLQRVVEALSGVQLHKQNLRRLVESGGLVEGTGQVHLETGGRPAELFRFRREVLRERPAPGVGVPGLR